MTGRNIKATIFACCAVVAAVVTGVGLASATPVTLAAQNAAAISQPDAGTQQWYLNGANSVDVGYDGQNLVYSVNFTQNGSDLSGTLNDPYYPTTGPISGSVTGNSVTFTFTYPSGSIQGTRTYVGTINQAGAVSGTWTQTGSESPDNGSWTLANNAVSSPSSSPSPSASSSPSPSPSPSPSCSSSYQTVVTENAGNDNGLPQLFTDKITLYWCSDGSGHVQIMSSTQAPSVQGPGFGFSGLQIKALNAIGFTYGFTPATAPVPTIDNESSSASTTATGVSFNEDFSLGQSVVAYLATRSLKVVGATLQGLMRLGQLARLSTVLQQWWEGIVAAYDAWAAKSFGLPSWAADWIGEHLIDKIEEALKKLAEPIVTSITRSLESLGGHPTLSSVIDAVMSDIEIASDITLTTVEWAPQITVTVDRSSPPPSVSNADLTVGLYIHVEDPIVTTTPAS